jgi:hypothetical protein
VFAPHTHKEPEVASATPKLAPISALDHVFPVPICTGLERFIISFVPKAPDPPFPHVQMVPSFFIAPTAKFVVEICDHVLSNPTCTKELLEVVSFRPSIPEPFVPVDHKVPSLLIPKENPEPPVICVHVIPVEIITGLLTLAREELPNAPEFCPQPHSLLLESMAKNKPLPPRLQNTSV